MEAFQSDHPALEVIYTGSAQELSVDCDALVVVTEWDEFRQLDLNEIYQLMKGSVLIDGRNIFEPQKASELGFKYLSIGRELPEKTEKSEGDLLAQKTVA
jgi:UDPglucose 6-dehydrogenase